MNKVLLVGNGFDLAHGLLTKYEHFLEVMKNWKNTYILLKEARTSKVFAHEIYYNEYYYYAHIMNEDNLKELDRIMQTNSWVKYYSQCEAEIDGWIDFEREIYPVINLFETIFKLDTYNIIISRNEADAYIDIKKINPSLIRIARLWDKYFDFDNGFCVKPDYVSKQYGILKKKILQSLRDEFDEFIKAFEIYLLEFVYRVEHTEVLEQIKNINADYVISLNYTPTENWYGIDKNNVHHLHGVIREDVNEDKYGKNANGEKNNMVVGVNEQKDQNMDFIYFVKYFQRIQKASGTSYKDFVDQIIIDSNGDVMRKPYELHIYGHSLDETDEDILKHLIGKINANGEFVLKPKEVFIYYYNQSDYEQKVINLIKLYGRSIVEEYMENKLFEFIPTDSTKCVI